jgi:hypothetical protein
MVLSIARFGALMLPLEDLESYSVFRQIREYSPIWPEVRQRAALSAGDARQSGLIAKAELEMEPEAGIG